MVQYIIDYQELVGVEMLVAGNFPISTTLSNSITKQ